MNEQDALFTMWNRWLVIIKKDVTSLSMSRHIFWAVQEMIEANPKIQLASTFYKWMGSAYGVSQSIGLRRQIDPRRDTISFRRLLEEIARQPAVISRKRYVALYRNPVLREEVADQHFDRFAGVGKPHINRAMVRKDCDQLVKKVEGMKDHVDKRIAHYAQQGPTRPQTYGDIDDCLDLVEALLIKYLEVLRAEAHLEILPTWQYDWKQIFRHPWIPSGG
jgi:hypothetical protein